jgi:DNA invertase Pin-like site-specific DNA recombinase
MPKTDTDTEAKRAALYARVSTVGERQDPETQLQRLREYADRRGFEAAGEYVDTGSGLDAGRPAYGQLREAARRREIDVVLVWRYDRFSRACRGVVSYSGLSRARKERRRSKM